MNVWPSAVEIGPLALAVTLVGGFLYCIAKNVDRWPFSSFPMFALRKEPDRVRVYRPAFELASGELTFWRPHFIYSAFYFDLAFARIAREAGRDRVQFEERAQRLLTATFELMKARGDVPRTAIRRLVVVQRTVAGASGALRTRDRVVCAAPVSTGG